MAMGRRIDQLGFDGLWSNDHLLPVAGGGRSRSRSTVDRWDGWMTLAGWAERTSHVRLGCLVSGVAYRDPPLLVRMATALDHASGGRAVLGLGAGWHATEHATFGYDYPSLRQRLDRLEEAATMRRQMLDGEAAHLEGAWFAARGARNEPAPLQPRLPLLIGGSGERRTLPIVARCADIWNGEGDPDTFARKSAVLDELCRAEVATRRRSNARSACHRPHPRDRTEAARLLADRLVRHGLSEADAAVAAGESPFVGSVRDVAMTLARYDEAGASEVIFDWPSPADEDTLLALAGPVREALRDVLGPSGRGDHPLVCVRATARYPARAPARRGAGWPRRTEHPSNHVVAREKPSFRLVVPWADPCGRGVRRRRHRRLRDRHVERGRAIVGCSVAGLERRPIR